jgi:hypothetical protein
MADAEWRVDAVPADFGDKLHRLLTGTRAVKSAVAEMKTDGVLKESYYEDMDVEKSSKLSQEFPMPQDVLQTQKHLTNKRVRQDFLMKKNSYHVGRANAYKLLLGVMEKLAEVFEVADLDRKADHEEDKCTSSRQSATREAATREEEDDVAVFKIMNEMTDIEEEFEILSKEAEELANSERNECAKKSLAA